MNIAGLSLALVAYLDKIDLEIENNLLNLNPSKTEVWDSATKLDAWLKAGIPTLLIQ